MARLRPDTTIGGKHVLNYIDERILELISVLAGGTTGQVLKKASDDDYDFIWVTDE